MSNVANGRGNTAIHDYEVVIRIEREMVGIKWAFSLSWSASELLSKQAWHGKERSTEAELLKKTTTILGSGVSIHVIPSG
jgi:hypothetical protein